MGSKNSNESRLNLTEYVSEPDHLLPLNRRSNILIPSIVVAEEEVEAYEFNYKSIVEYLCSSYQLAPPLDFDEFEAYNTNIDRLSEFNVSDEAIETAEMVSDDSDFSPIIVEIDGKKYFLRTINLNYNEAKIYPEDLKEKAVYPYQYFHNRDTLKELRILRTHRRSIFPHCLGYCIKDTKIYLVYEFYQTSLRQIIEDQSLDYNNKIILLKNILEMVKILHTEAVISLNLSVDSIRFTSNGDIKLCCFKNSFDMLSGYDIDRSSKIFKKTDLYFPPEIILDKTKETNWQSDIWSLGVIIASIFSNKTFRFDSWCLNQFEEGKIPDILFSDISDIHIQSMVIGLLRYNSNQRPNVFETIDMFNKFIQIDNQSESLIIRYTKQHVLKFSKIFQKATYYFLVDYFKNQYTNNENEIEIVMKKNQKLINNHDTFVINDISHFDNKKERQIIID